MRKNKLLIALIDRLVELMEESENIFWSERQYAFLKPSERKIEECQIIPNDEERLDNEFKIKKTIEKIERQLAHEFPEKKYGKRQQGIFSMVE